MGSPRKIGVLTFHRSINYGSYWQARCLVEGLHARGHDAELLDHDCERVRRCRARLRAAAGIAAANAPARSSRPMPPRPASSREAARVAAAVAPVRSHEPEGAGEYDLIVVGSDEVWNFRHPWYGSKPIFFGEELSAERLVSYAASFGNHSAWHGIDPGWARKLDRFSQVSVRDENSWHLVRNGTGREPALVLDPCLQFRRLCQASRSRAPSSRYAAGLWSRLPGVARSGEFGGGRTSEGYRWSASAIATTGPTISS